ncbi:MAG TPA: TonB-dependent receptor [Candidatus Cybelea sp.]|jgi:outer membrane receptor protein involved in Fe transport|nr:TonB-dependent receptor [Candidatus Cybelea sp.]
MGRIFARASRAALAAVVIASFAGVDASANDQPSAPGQGVTLSVSVRSSDGRPVAGATVSVTAGGFARSGATDSRGVVELSDLQAGTYALDAVAPGFQPISQRTVSIARDDEQLSIVLYAATTNSLTVIGQVRSTAGETVSTASAPTISLSAQQAAAAGVTSVGPMIWNQLSTTPVIPLGGGSNATQTFAVRGPDPTETTVDIDGHQVNNGNTGDFDLSLVDPAALQEVEIVYGIAPSSLIGPNTIGGGINITTLQPTIAPHGLVRFFGGSYGTYGGTVQATGTADRLGYAFSLHGTSSLGSVNQTISAPPADGSSDDNVSQSVGSNSWGNSLITKLRYQLGGPNGYGYLQLNFRNQNVVKDESALLTNFTPPGFTGSGGDDDALHVGSAIRPADDDDDDAGGFQSFAGTYLMAHQSNYGFDAQVPLGNQMLDGAPATMLSFSHLTSVNGQSVTGPGEATLPYMYNQRDLLGDDWLLIDHRFSKGLLSFKYDLETETLGTNYVQGQVTAEGIPIGNPIQLQGQTVSTDAILPNDRPPPPVQTLTVGQTERSAVLRYNGDPTSHIHYSVAGYYSNFSSFGTSFDPRAGFVWTPTGNTAVRASVGTTFQIPQLSELVVPPPADRVPVGGIIFIGNPTLQPDRATDYDLGMEQIIRDFGNPLHLAFDLYQTNLRSPANQLNVDPVPGCQTPRKPTPCPLSYPVNAGNGIYRGLDIHADQQLGRTFHVRAGWDVDSSYLTTIPANIQDGTLVPNEQSLGQPLHKAYFALDQESGEGLSYGARLNYEGDYNELNRSPYATLDAHVAYRNAGFEYGLYGTNLTNVYSSPFAIVGGGVPYGTLPGQPMITPNAFVLQGAQVIFVLTRSI